MLLKIIQTGDDTLRNMAQPVTKAQLTSKKIQDLIDLMIITLHDAPGVGLAAPQVGESLQLLVIHDKKDYHDQVPASLLAEQRRKPLPITVMVNPVLAVTNPNLVTYFEGCLSIDGYVGAVQRAKQVTVTGWDRQGKKITITASDWYARVLQHEIDHLVGALYVDKINLKSFISQKNFNLKWRKCLQAEIIAKFGDRTR